MVKVSVSNIHHYNTVFIITSGTKSNAGDLFLFEESMKLFGGQNLASNLIECSDGSEEFEAFINTEEFNDLIKKVESTSQKHAVFFEIKIADLADSEIVFEYYELSLPKLIVERGPHNLNSHYSIKAEAKSLTSVPSLFKNNVFRNRYFGRIVIGQQFYLTSKDSLRANLMDKVSTRYVTSQVPFIMIPPAVSAFTPSLKSGPKSESTTIYMLLYITICYVAAGGIMLTLNTVPYIHKVISTTIGIYLAILGLAVLEVTKTDGYLLFERPRKLLSAKPLKATFLALFVCAGCMGIYIALLEAGVLS